MPSRRAAAATPWIAGGEGHHAGASLRGVELDEPVERTAKLEGPGVLQRLELEQDPRPGQLIEWSGVQQWCAPRLAGDALRGSEHVCMDRNALHRDSHGCLLARGGAPFST
jgi:hypothetical protein